MPYIQFELPIGEYVYERNQNKVYTISKFGYEQGSIQSDNDMQTWLERRNIDTSNSIETIENPETDELDKLLQTDVAFITLQVTQNCNLRCSYCAYSGAYYNRTHNKKTMSFAVAKKAVDFLLSHSTASDDISVGFYGGEPLLEFGLIKEVVAYTESVCWGKNVSYAITTNATLLKGEILDFLVEKNFKVMISLDGPKEVHDQNRVFSDGRGSYDIVMRNIANIKKLYPIFYKQVMTNTVLSPDEDYQCVQRYFDTDAVVSELNSRLSLISTQDIKEEINYPDRLYITQNEELVKVMLYMLGKLDKRLVSKIYLSLADKICESYESLKLKGTVSKCAHPGGPCTPAKHRLFIDVDGNFYPCERVSECPRTEIGNLETGFDVQQIKDCMNVGKLTETACKNCWAFLHCNQCIASCLDRNVFSSGKRLQECNRSRAGALDNIKNVVFLQHYGFDFERWYIK